MNSGEIWTGEWQTVLQMGMSPPIVDLQLAKRYDQERWTLMPLDFAGQSKWNHPQSTSTMLFSRVTRMGQ